MYIVRNYISGISSPDELVLNSLRLHFRNTVQHLDIETGPVIHEHRMSGMVGMSRDNIA